MPMIIIIIIIIVVIITFIIKSYLSILFIKHSNLFIGVLLWFCFLFSTARVVTKWMRWLRPWTSKQHVLSYQSNLGKACYNPGLVPSSRVGISPNFFFISPTVCNIFATHLFLPKSMGDTFIPRWQENRTSSWNMPSLPKMGFEELVGLKAKPLAFFGYHV